MTATRRNKTMATYKDKLKPIPAPTTPSYKTKLKPIEPVAPAAPAQKKGFFPKLKASVNQAAEERGQKVRDILKAGKTGQQTKAETIFQLGGQAIGGAFEGPTALIKNLTPKPVKTIVKKAIFNPVAKYVQHSADIISDIPAVQKFAQTPGAERLARNVEAVPEYLNLLPGPKAAKLATRGVEGGLNLAEKTATKSSGMFTKFAEEQATKRASKATKEIDELAGKIGQGKPQDIEQVKKALSNVEVKGVKTYKQLRERIDEKIKLVSNKLDEVLAKNPTTRTIANLKTVVNVGDQKVATNYVNEAIQQLDNYYKTTNNLAGQAKIQNILSRGNTSGLTIKDINDLARLHGQDLSGFNKLSGQLASGLSRQAAENTRKGLKFVARDLFGDKLYQTADGEIQSLIRTRDLSKHMVESVNKLAQKTVKLGLGEQLKQKLLKIADLASLGGIKSFGRFLFRNDPTTKTLNALFLEKGLAKNLTKIKSLLNKGDLSREDIIQYLNSYEQESQFGKPLLLPEKAGMVNSTITLPRSARETNLGIDEVRNAKINQSSSALPDNQPNTINASNTDQNVDINKVIPRNDAIVDPYIPEDQLPTIQMGRLPKRKIEGPVVDYGTNPAVFGAENKDKMAILSLKGYVPDAQIPGVISMIEKSVKDGDLSTAKILFEKLPPGSAPRKKLAKTFDNIKI